MVAATGAKAPVNSADPSTFPPKKAFASAVATKFDGGGPFAAMAAIKWEFVFEFVFVLAVIVGFQAAAAGAELLLLLLFPLWQW